MILIDFTQTIIAGLMVQLKLNDGQLSEDKLRPMIINSIRNYQKKYARDYGEIVLCTDAGNPWRREYYPQYKANRKKARDADDKDWGTIFDTLQVIKDELRDNFPYRYMYVEKCEADDIIAVLVKHAKEPVLIVSGDKDFQQLHAYDGVRQWSPNLNKFIDCVNPQLFLKEHILTGDK
jgi:5'-3' exonuclease